MKLWNKIAISLLLLILGVPLVIAGLFIYTADDMCGNEVYSEVLSPDGEYKAVVFQRDCGATTGFSTQVSIIHSGVNLKNEGGNVYIIDGHPRDTLLVARWLSDAELRIEKSLSGSEYKAEFGWGFMNNINVTYGAD